jgi:endoglucanase
MIFTVTLSTAYDQAVTVNFSIRNGSAKAGLDYVTTSGKLTFAAGQTTKTITVLIKGDTKRESDEHFQVVLSRASSNAMIDALWDGFGTIIDDDGRKR